MSGSKVIVFLKLFICIFVLPVNALEFKNTTTKNNNNIIVDKFNNYLIMRYRTEGFDSLTLQQKKLAYYLYKAGLSGRDIYWDQNFKYNLVVRRTLENIYNHQDSIKNKIEFEQLVIYLKEVWFSNGIHDHTTGDKIKPRFSKASFSSWVKDTFRFSNLLKTDFENDSQLLKLITPVIFDKNDNYNIADFYEANSTTNYYDAVNANEAIQYYSQLQHADSIIPHGLNTTLTKKDDRLLELTWSSNGKYASAIKEMIKWLTKAKMVTENELQKSRLDALIDFYTTGNLQSFNDSNIAWVKDKKSDVEFSNGFIETFRDPLNFKGAYQSILGMRNIKSTERINRIADRAKWFEDNSPINDEFKNHDVEVRRSSALTVLAQSGLMAPFSHVGIFLPNSEWIQEKYGHKFFYLENVVNSFDDLDILFLKEFAWNSSQLDRINDYYREAGRFFIDVRETVGYNVGKYKAGVSDVWSTLGANADIINEAKSDLVSLYFGMDEQLVQDGIITNIDSGKTLYEYYIRNGILIQLRKITQGDEIPEDYMKHRQMISLWAIALGAKDKVIELRKRDGKNYIVINDFEKLRQIFAYQLRELQRIKSEGDAEAADQLVHQYGSHLDTQLRDEVVQRFKSLDIPAYSGFITPMLSPEMKDGEIIDIKLTNSQSFVEQMLDYADNDSYLPNFN